MAYDEMELDTIGDKKTALFLIMSDTDSTFNFVIAILQSQLIFEYLCDLYNYLDSSIHVQFTYPNRKSDREQLARSFEMPPCNDGLDPIRQEQTDILKRQLARGNNGSVKTKYITYTIEADNLKAARARLSRISLDIQGYFKIMGAVSRVLDGKERLEVLHGIMHPDGERFNFDWKWLAAGGLSTKDFIAPSSFAFKNTWAGTMRRWRWTEKSARIWKRA